MHTDTGGGPLDRVDAVPGLGGGLQDVGPQRLTFPGQVGAQPFPWPAFLFDSWGQRFPRDAPTVAGDLATPDRDTARRGPLGGLAGVGVCLVDDVVGGLQLVPQGGHREASRVGLVEGHQTAGGAFRRLGVGDHEEHGTHRGAKRARVHDPYRGVAAAGLVQVPGGDHGDPLDLGPLPDGAQHLRGVLVADGLQLVRQGGHQRVNPDQRGAPPLHREGDAGQVPRDDDLRRGAVDGEAGPHDVDSVEVGAGRAQPWDEDVFDAVLGGNDEGVPWGAVELAGQGPAGQVGHEPAAQGRLADAFLTWHQGGGAERDTAVPQVGDAAHVDLGGGHDVEQGSEAGPPVLVVAVGVGGAHHDDSPARRSAQ